MSKARKVLALRAFLWSAQTIAAGACQTRVSDRFLSEIFIF
jgi:hypothetical protein